MLFLLVPDNSSMVSIEAMRWCRASRKWLWYFGNTRVLFIVSTTTVTMSIICIRSMEYL